MNKNQKSAGAKKTTVAPETTKTEVVKETTTTTVAQQPQVSNNSEDGETKQLGRPVNPTSARQKKIAEREALIAAGNAPHRGRKPVAGSKRQARLAELEEKRKQGLLTGKRGRPAVPGSKHQQKLAQMQARIAENGGIPMKPGRPPYTAEQKAAAAEAKKAKIAAAKAEKAAAQAAAQPAA